MTKKSDKKESVDLLDMRPLEADEEVKEEKRLKIFNSKQTTKKTFNLISLNKSLIYSYK